MMERFILGTDDSLQILNTDANGAKVTDDNANFIERLELDSYDSLPVLDTNANIPNVS
jgi:hypothetical protein